MLTNSSIFFRKVYDFSFGNKEMEAMRVASIWNALSGELEWSFKMLQSSPSCVKGQMVHEKELYIRREMSELFIKSKGKQYVYVFIQSEAEKILTATFEIVIAVLVKVLKP